MGKVIGSIECAVGGHAPKEGKRAKDSRRWLDLNTLSFVADLVNIRSNENDGRLAELLRAEHPEGKNMIFSPADLGEVRAQSVALLGLWRGDEAAIVELVNSLARESSLLLQLVQCCEGGYTLQPIGDGRPSTFIAQQAVSAMTGVIVRKELHRLHVCNAPECDNVFVDRTKNQSRLFCCAACGNRVSVAAYRA